MNPTTNTKSLLAALVAVCGLHASTSFATITGVTGAIVNEGQLASGANLGLGATQSDTIIRAYSESQVTLGAALGVDAVGSAFTTAGNIAIGTQVQSYLLHLDPLSSDTAHLTGTITFSTAILGVIFNDATLNATDSTLGVSGVTYFKGTDRGLEAGQDTFTISGNSLTFSGNFTASTVMDEARIVTAAVPEPTTMVAGALLLLPFGAGALRTLRKNRTK